MQRIGGTLVLKICAQQSWPIALDRPTLGHDVAGPSIRLPLRSPLLRSGGRKEGKTEDQKICACLIGPPGEGRQQSEGLTTERENRALPLATPAERLTIRQAPLATMRSLLSLLLLLLGGPVLAWVTTVYTRLSGTNDRAPFRPERTGNFPVAANETAADMLCCALYPRIQTFPSTDLHLHGGRAPSQEVSTLTIRKNLWVGR